VQKRVSALKLSRSITTAIKTEAIDATSNFWWIDDDPTEHDRNWLCFHNREDRLIRVSADHDPGALAVARAMLERAISSREMVGMIPAIRLCDLSFLETSQLQGKYPYDEKATGKQRKPKNRKNARTHSITGPKSIPSIGCLVRNSRPWPRSSKFF
jgi:hypothetical protein